MMGDNSAQGDVSFKIMDSWKKFTGLLITLQEKIPKRLAGPIIRISNNNQK
jgi:hypothetical protein